MNSNSFMRVRVQKKCFFKFGKNDRVQRVRVRSPATFMFYSQRAKKSSSENLVESKKKVASAEAQFFAQNQVKSK